MQPIEIVERVKANYKTYIRTAFPIADDTLRAQLFNLIEQSDLLWRGPYLSLQRPYVRSERTLNEQKDVLGLHTQLLTAGSFIDENAEAHPVFGEWVLYRHQQQAIEQILRKKNTIICSGTGSGKTEAFFLPILNYCLENPGLGIKALIVYPMNALANDQYDRFARYLANTGVTFARYTGDTPDDENDAKNNDKDFRPDDLCKEAIWYRHEIRGESTRPNILMTNYAMLEYLLLRKLDRVLFDGQLQFLVLDEVHTYHGARGIEVSCLIRRLKEHVDKLDGKLVCIGTSATVKGDAREPVARFATELFGEHFAKEHIVTEEFQPFKSLEDPYLAATPSVELEDIQKLKNLSDLDSLQEFCREFIAPDSRVTAALEAARQQHDFHLDEFLGHLLSNNLLFRAIEEFLAEPRSLVELTLYLQNGNPENDSQLHTADENHVQKGIRAGADETYLRREVEAYLLLGSKAKLNGQPLIRPKVHMFWRGLQGFYRCTNLACGELYLEYVDFCPTCHARCLPIEVCRNCGQDYFRAYPDDPELNFEVLKTSKKKKFRDILTGLLPLTLLDEPSLNLTPIHFTYNLQEQSEDTDEEADYDEGNSNTNNIQLLYCATCGKIYSTDTQQCDCDKSGSRTGLETDLHAVITYFDKMHKCLACAGVYGGGLEIVTPVRSGTMVSINILVEAIFQNLTPQQRRLLIFCDNRQDTAFQAAYLSHKHTQFIGRQLIYQALIELQAGSTNVASMGKLQNLIYQLRIKNEIFCPKPSRDAEGRIYDLIRKPENPDEKQLEEKDIQLGLLAEIAKPGSRRVSLEGLGLLSVEYSNAERSLLEIACENEALAQKYGFGVETFGDLLAAILDEMRWKRALSHPMLVRPLNGRATYFGRASLPVGFRTYKCDTDRLPFRIYGYLSQSGGQTSLLNFISKIVGKNDAVSVLSELVIFLQQQGFIIETQIGNERHSMQVEMVNHQRMMLTIPKHIYRCNLCRNVTTHNINGVCPRWRCEGYLES
ncbi:MAG: DEAD/DEAH box helicase, partial [bacterium]